MVFVFVVFVVVIVGVVVVIVTAFGHSVATNGLTFRASLSGIFLSRRV